MVQRHTSLPHTFYCFTEDSRNLNPNIRIKSLPKKDLTGWWWKPYIFAEEHFNKGDINFYLDLDMVIVNNIDHLINYEPERFVGLRDVGRVFRPEVKTLGSAVMRWTAGSHCDIWTKINSDFNICKRFHGDQNYIFQLYGSSLVYYPDPWILSYKWEVRDRKDVIGRGENSNFSFTANPPIPHDCAILAFHGNPRPHVVKDPIIVEHWR